jgi:transcriptional regulator with GAF, ATPase, and Fis domain
VLAVAARWKFAYKLVLSMGLRPSIADRYSSLLKASEIARTNSTMQGVFQGICGILRQIVPYDRAGLSLYNPDQDNLKIVDIYGPHENSIFLAGHFLNRKTSQSGWVFDHKEPMFRRDLASDARFPGDRKIIGEGYFSICSVPLVVRGQSIGVLSVLGERKDQLTADHAEIVEEVSHQIALAIASIAPRCQNHANTRVVCPRCIGAAGGKTTVSKHREDLSNWGRKGGRGRKNNTVQP